MPGGVSDASVRGGQTRILIAVVKASCAGIVDGRHPEQGPAQRRRGTGRPQLRSGSGLPPGFYYSRPIGPTLAEANSGVGIYAHIKPDGNRLANSARPALRLCRLQRLLPGGCLQCIQVCLLVLRPFFGQKKRAGIKNLPIINRYGNALTRI